MASPRVTYQPVPQSSSGGGSVPRWRRGSSSGNSGFLSWCACSLPTVDVTTERLNLTVSYFAGVLFSAAWWLLIDAHVLSVRNADDDGSGSNVSFSGAMLWWFYIPGILSSVALIMINLVTPDAFSGDALVLDDSAATKARIWLFCAFILSFGGLLGSGWILFALYVVPDEAGDVLPSYKWPGVALLLQNILIFVSAVTMRFGRRASNY